MSKLIVNPKNLAWLGLVGLGIMLLSKLWLCNERSQLMVAFPAPNWLGVIPGQTTEQEIVQQFGAPNRSTYGGYYRASLDWLDEIELTRGCFCGQTVHHYKLHAASIYIRAGKV